MRIAVSALLSTVFLLATSGPVSAQSWSGRGYISFNAGVQATTNDFADRFEFERNVETGSTDVDYPVKAGVFYDGGAGVRLWKGLGAGVSVSFFSRDDSAEITAQIPHPFFFDRPREVTGTLDGVTRSETGVHVQLMYMLDPSGPLRVVLFGGPSFFSVEQDLVTEVRYAETYPFDTATFTTADVNRENGSAVGFNAGADVMWEFHRNFAAGALLRFARASVDLDAPNNRSVSVDAGGFHAGGGIRVIF
jgi:hypothetical protein